VTTAARAQIRDLLARLADGDRRAIEPAFDALWPIVRQFCARAVPTAADAEDAAQQAIVRAFEQIADYDRERDGLAWVLTIAGYEARTIRRRAGRRREDPLGPFSRGGRARELTAHEADPETALVEQDLVAAAREVLASLKVEDAATLAAALGLPGANARDGVAPATFRKRLQRALERLRVAWRTKHGTP
jgi:RNA polymerase sigma-70 factor (ECF subfamily)